MIFSNTIHSQWCGNVASEIDVQRLLNNKKAVANGISVRNGVTVYVPVTFHIVSDANGNGGLTEDFIATQMCRLNEDYAPLDMVFYLKDQTFNYVNHTALFNDPTSSSGGTRMVIEKAGAGSNSINVFITQSANTDGLGTTLGYYDPNLDLIVLRKDQVNATTGTLSHELGHFFSLLHVFNGWDQEAWDEDIHGIPVNSQYSPGGVLNELADGSNCAISGDFLCDTPADYNLGFSWTGCSTYGGGCQDVNGNELDPQEDNYMSYFIGCSQYVFSNMQQEMVLADYDSPARNFLKVGYVPNTQALGEVTITGPQDGAVESTYNDVMLDWEDTDNAIGYVVSVKRLITENKYYTTSSYLNLPELDSGKKYTWRVMPISEIGGCGEFTEFIEFTSGTVASNNEIELVDLAIKNTIVSNETVLFESNRTMDLSIQLYNVSGQLISSTTNNFLAGSNVYSTPEELKTGMYFLRIVDEANAGKTFKIIISE